MIILVVAIYCEAKPLIEKYRLKKDDNYKPFTVFSDEEKNIILIVSGAGNAAASSAVAAVCAYAGIKPGKSFLVNIGTCGISCKNTEQETVNGNIYICNKITDVSTNRTFYPDMVYKTPFSEAQIMTHAVLFQNKNDKTEPDKNYSCRKIALHDMEAAYIWQAGSYFFAPHEMSFIKIISDNGDTDNIKPQYITSLVQENIDVIDIYIKSLAGILHSSDVGIDNKREKEIADRLCRDLCCSKTMEHELRQYVRYCMIENIDVAAIAAHMYEEKELPCTDRREGKKRFEELKTRLL